ncbi:MAG: DUF222 domain-containing protein, partial [Dermatophilaceae bacterium]
MWARLYATDGVVIEQRVEETARSVCDADPRNADERRADALTAAVSHTAMACECGQPDCPGAAHERPPKNAVVYVVADEKSVQAATAAAAEAAPSESASSPAQCPAPPAFVFGGGVLPTPLLGAILDRATLREVRHPGQAAPEPRYTPSRKIAEFVQCRDLTCRFPGCDKSAQVCDIDHTVLYPVGPTHASNLKCLCRFHHSTKTVCSPDQAVQTQESRKRTWPPRQDLGWWPGAIAMARLLDHKRLATTHPTSQRQLTAALDSPCFTLALHQGRLSGGGLTRQGCSAGVPGSDMGRA